MSKTELVRYENSQAQQKELMLELERWRWILKNDLSRAKNMIIQVIRKVRDNNSSDPSYLNRIVSRLKQGVETPDDYGVRT